MEVNSIRTKVFQPNSDLLEFIRGNVPRVKENSVIVITSKIVSVAQGRLVPGGDKNAKNRAIKAEAEKYIKTKWCYLALKDGHWCPNGGIDASNAPGKQLILWPENLYRVANDLRTELKNIYGIKRLGILITDSRSAPLRAGISGVALSYAGFKGLRSYEGKKDIFGRKMGFISRTNVADSLAAAAVLTMGEGREQKPLAVIKEAPVEFIDKSNPHELKVDLKKDLYRPLYRALETRKIKD